MKKIVMLIVAIVASLSLFACSSYRTVYRIETKSGEKFYSADEPDLNKKKGIYEIEDLDGNEYELKIDSIFKIEKYKRKK